MLFSAKDLERKAKEQKKEREEKQERIVKLTNDLFAWIVAQDNTLGDVAMAIQTATETLRKMMESKTLPVIKEWNARKFSDFYNDKKE